MNQKLQNRVEEMKQQTFGVEIEMTGISRKEAIVLVSKYFTGSHADITHVGGYYDKYTCEDRQGRKWTVMYDGSIITTNSQRAYSVELVTPILTYEDVEDLQGIVRKLRRAGAISNPSHECGVHIHIGANGHNPQTLRNLTNLMASHEELIAEAIGMDENRKRTWCKVVDPYFLTEVNKKKPETMAELADIWYEGHPDRTYHYNSSRYHMLNLHATFTKGTVEFRMFNFDNPTDDRKGGLHAGQLKSWIQFCLMISQVAKDSKSISPKPVQMENKKFAMRPWLSRMGLIGDEFKTCRYHLTHRLSGNGANRFAEGH